MPILPQFEDPEVPAGIPSQVGTSGSDTLRGAGAADFIGGLAGVDRIFGQDGNDTLVGGDGSDSLYGEDGSDSLYGGDGNDRIWGGRNDDTIVDGLGSNLLDGGNGNDVLLAGDGRDTLIGGNGHDTLIGGEGLNTLTGGNGSDWIAGGDDRDSISGGKGDDTLYGAGGANVIHGGAGDDVMGALGGRDTISGGAGDDRIDGGNGHNRLDGGDGNDTLYAGAGSDKITSGKGADLIEAGGGNNTIDGGHGADTLVAGDGKDKITGGKGADLIDAGAGNDTIDSGRGNDTVAGGDGNDRITANDGHDLIDAGAGNDRIYAGRGSDTVFAGDGDDFVTGGGGKDLLTGGAGDDTLDGGDANDVASYVLADNVGASDLYSGGRGRDTLRLILTPAELARNDVQADLAAYDAFLAAHTDRRGEADYDLFQFSAFGLAARMFEKVELEIQSTLTLVDDAVVISEDSGQQSFASVLQNDDISEGIASVALITVPASGGILTFVTDPGSASVGTFAFDPAGQFDDLAAGETRDVQFVYEVIDRAGEAARAGVVISVTGVNDAPIAMDDAFETETDQTITFSLADLLANDTDADLPDGVILTLAGLDTSGLEGQLTDNGDGTYTYDPDGQFRGVGPEGRIDRFTYMVSDPDGATATADVDINVVGDRPPLQQATFGPIFVFINQTLTYSFGADAFADDDAGSTLAYAATIVGGAPLPDWLTFDPGTRSFTGTPVDTDVAVSRIEIVVTEEDGQSTSVEVPLTVLNGNIVDGTDANDDLAGTVDGDLLRGFDGNDTLTGGIGIDLLLGGEGRDSLYGGQGGDVLDGGAGNDSLFGEDGDDVLYGGAGRNYLDGGNGDDLLFAGDDGDLNSLSGGNGNDTIYGGSGNDGITTGGGDDIVYAGDGSDNIVAAGGAIIEAGNGNDTVQFYNFSEGSRVDLGDGADLFINGVNSSGRFATIDLTLGAGQDTVELRVTGSRETIQQVTNITDFAAGTEGDVINLSNLLASLPGYDGVSNPFPDFFRLMQDGADTLLLVDFDGAAGPDDAQLLVRLQNVVAATLTYENVLPGYNPHGGPTPGLLLEGTEFADTLTGGVGDDTLRSNDGDDEVTGGEGNDILEGGRGSDRLVGGSGSDSLLGGVGNDTLIGGANDDTLRGGAGDDSLSGGQGANLLDGGDGDDSIGLGGSGQTGASTIFGGNGNDVVDALGPTYGHIIDLGEGNDQVEVRLTSLAPQMLTLGGGRDEIVVLNAGVFVGHAPIVTDFAVGAVGDLITFGANFAGQITGHDGATNLFADGYLLLSQRASGTMILVDADAADVDSTPHETLFLQGVTATELTAENFDNGFDPAGTMPGSATLAGGAGDDSIWGTAGSDLIEAGAGTGRDTVDGGYGHDVINGDWRNLEADGGPGDDTITGNGRLDGSFGKDVLMGNGTLWGGTGNDLLTAGIGNSSLFGGEGRDTLLGGAGNDTLYGANGSADAEDDYLSGGDGHDLIDSRGGADTILGGEGNDTIKATGSAAVIDAGPGNDSVEFSYRSGPADITLGTGQDILNLIGSPDGANALRILDFEAGDDGDILDLLGIVAGNDGVSNPFGEGFLRIMQSGSDAIIQVARSASIATYRDAVILVDTDIGDVTTANLGGLASDGSGVSGQNTLGSTGSDSIAGSYGDDTLLGDAGDDTLEGGNGADSLTGGGDADSLAGGFGVDTLSGGTGDDTLIGGDRGDVLSGGAGSDEFVLLRPEDGGDIISDFTRGEDVLVLNLAGFGLTDAPTLVLAAAPTGAGPTLTFDAATHVLRFDLDGTGAEADVQLVTLEGLATLAEADFVFT